jgi:hypothetical protein
VSDGVAGMPRECEPEQACRFLCHDTPNQVMGQGGAVRSHRRHSGSTSDCVTSQRNAESRSSSCAVERKRLRRHFHAQPASKSPNQQHGDPRNATLLRRGRRFLLLSSHSPTSLSYLGEPKLILLCGASIVMPRFTHGVRGPVADALGDRATAPRSSASGGALSGDHRSCMDRRAHDDDRRRAQPGDRTL